MAHQHEPRLPEHLRLAALEWLQALGPDASEGPCVQEAEQALAGALRDWLAGEEAKAQLQAIDGELLQALVLASRRALLAGLERIFEDEATMAEIRRRAQQTASSLRLDRFVDSSNARQDVIAKMVADCQQEFRQPLDPKGLERYVQAAITNRLKDIRRATKSDPAALDEDVVAETERHDQSILGELAHVDELFADSLRFAKVEELLAHEPLLTRAAVLLKFNYGWTYTMLADAFAREGEGKEPDTVRQRRAEGMRTLVNAFFRRARRQLE
ncbi:MAG: hypothetical protein R3F49_16100 [Planctomycetota bacterium]